MELKMKEYNAILIGNGTMGRRHRERFENCGVRFARVLDVDAAEWIASEEAGALASRNIGLDAECNDGLPKVNFAVIASPASTHYEYARFFLEKKIPVLVEKPLATSATEALELVKLARANDTLLFVAQSECYNPIFLNFRKHLMVDLKNAVAASRSETKIQSDAAGFLPLNVKLEFRREHGYSERCRDVDVSLDLLVHDVSLFLNLFDAKDVAVVDEDCCGNRHDSACSDVSCGRGDRVRKCLKVVSGEFAGVEASFIADRNSPRDVRTISVEFDRNGQMPGFDYSVSLVRYTNAGEVAHIPDSLDNEHRFFLKLLAGACRDWSHRAMMNAADAVILATHAAK